jgi:hypothetical protein
MRDNRTGEYYCFNHRECIYSRPFPSEAPRPKPSMDWKSFGAAMATLVIFGGWGGFVVCALVDGDIKKTLLIMLCCLGGLLCLGLASRVLHRIRD